VSQSIASLSFNKILALVNTTITSLPNFDSSCAAAQPWDIGTAAWKLEGVDSAVRSIFLHRYHRHHLLPVVIIRNKYVLL